MHQEIEMSLKGSNKIFAIEGDANYTYADLLKMIRCLHTVLRKKHFSKVLISGKQSFFSYASLIGIYLIGGTFCVLNEDIPKSRKQCIIDNFKPDVFLCEKNMILDVEIPIYNFEDIFSLVEYDEDINNIFRNDIIYVSFTSGTTGSPKGCKISRNAFEKFCEEALAILKLCEDDVCAQYVPLSFDMSLIDIFGGVLKRVTLVAFNSNSHKLRPGKYLLRYKITFLNVVPHFITILENGGDFDSRHLENLRMIRFGGDKITKEYLNKIFMYNPSIEIVSTYGTTETTCFCLYKVLNIENYETLCTTHAVVGKPLNGWMIELDNVDPQGVGNLIVYGNYIGEGYIGEDLKGAFFIKQGLDKTLYKAYRTGDYFRMHNNELLFVGRNDSQIKINGKRFDLGEIEYIIYGLGASEVCAIYKGGKIYLYYTLSEKLRINTEEILMELESKIPSFALPQNIMRLEQMPHNINGKIDKNALNQMNFNVI